MGKFRYEFQVIQICASVRLILFVSVWIVKNCIGCIGSGIFEYRSSTVNGLAMKKSEFSFFHHLVKRTSYIEG